MGCAGSALTDQHDIFTLVVNITGFFFFLFPSSFHNNVPLKNLQPGFLLLGGSQAAKTLCCVNKLKYLVLICKMRGFHFHFFFETWVVDNQDISDWKNKQTILTRYVLQNWRPRCHSHTTPPNLRLSKPNDTQRHGVHCRTRRLLFCFVSCANLPEKWWSRSFGSDSPGQRGSASPPPLYPPTTGAATSSSVASGRSDTEETILRQTRVICEGLWRRGRGGGIRRRSPRNTVYGAASAVWAVRRMVRCRHSKTRRSAS